jgi:ribose transport system permease protein
MKLTNVHMTSFLRSTLFLPAVLLTSLLLINWLLQPNFFAPHVVRLNILTFSSLCLVAMGQAIIMIGGNLDLSVGSGLSLINCVIAMNMSMEPEMAVHNGLVLGVAFVIAIVMGIINGCIVGYLKVPSFIATFATAFIWWGVAIKVCPVPGGAVPGSFTKFFKANLGPFNVIFLLVVLTALGWVLLNRFRLGRYIFAIGSSKEAAYSNGISVNKVTLAAFAIGWIFVYLGTLALTIQTRAGDAAVGDPYALNSIAAAVVGGVSMKGGVGSPFGAIMGAISLSIIMNIIYFSGLPTSFQVLVRGIIIIIALGATVVFKRKYRE